MTKDIPGYEGLYTIDTNGIATSLKSGRPIAQSVQRGYRVLNLYKDGKLKRMYVHRAVALAFIPNPLNKSDVNHIDSDRGNNHIENLEWCTRMENNYHAYNKGRMPQWSNPANARKTYCKRGHPLSGSNVRVLTHAKGYRVRQCRECHLIRQRERRARLHRSAGTVGRPRSLLTPRLVVNIRHCKGSISGRKLAKLYRVHPVTIYGIWTNYRWKKLPSSIEEYYS